jgi:hypothetical protein
MTGLGRSIEQPAQPFKLPSLKKIADILGIRRPHATTQSTAVKAEKVLSESEINGNMLASSILEVERNIALTQITGKDLEQRILEEMVPASKRGKLGKAGALATPKK